MLIHTREIVSIILFIFNLHPVGGWQSFGMHKRALATDAYPFC